MQTPLTKERGNNEMEKGSLPKTIHIELLNEKQKEEVREKLTKTLTDLGHKEEELHEHVETGMNGRLCDVEELIDICELKTISVQLFK